MLNNLIVLALVILAVERTTEILVASTISEMTIKRWLSLCLNQSSNYGLRFLNGVATFLLALLACGYCTSVYVAFAFSVTAPRFFTNSLAQYIVMTMCLHGGANLYHALYELLRRGRVNSIDFNLNFRRITTDESSSGASVIPGATGSSE